MKFRLLEIVVKTDSKVDVEKMAKDIVKVPGVNEVVTTHSRGLFKTVKDEGETFTVQLKDEPIKKPKKVEKDE